MQSLELFESTHPGVVRGVVDDRGITTVVRVFGFEDERGQLFGLGSGCFQRDVLRHPLSLRAGTDIIRASDAGSGLDHGLRDQTPTGTAETVRSIVNWPSTRVPTYSTAVWPVATPSSTTSGTTRTPSSVTQADAGTGSAWARVCTPHAKSASTGAAPAQLNRVPEISAIARASFGPTTTVFDTGRTSSTNRGLPSAAGIPSLRPRR